MSTPVSPFRDNHFFTRIIYLRAIVSYASVCANVRARVYIYIYIYIYISITVEAYSRMCKHSGGYGHAAVKD